MKHRSQCAQSGAVPAARRPIAAKLALSLVFCASCLPVAAHGSQPAKSISLNAYPKGTNLVEQVVVPVPSEVFSVLDKLGKPAWAEVVRPQKSVASPSGGKEQISLLLGIVIADGFVAVEAENADEVKAIGNSVRTLAKTIGVERAVSRRANSIAEFADKRRWVEVRKELDLALSDVRQAMEELNSEALAHLVSLGGWLRGTEALSSVVSKGFTKDGAELLYQPVLIDHFNFRLNGLPPATKEHPLIVKILGGLREIQPLMGTGDGEISEKAVASIGRICGELVSAVSVKSH
ncbi:MAG: hypothetical protein EBS01_04810 [Verrucomicrobia bacterium]|nr:hypothetical protein [Verrucomicrobiota bacterium]